MTTMIDASSLPAAAKPGRRSTLLQRQGVVVALLLLILFGAWRYDDFFGLYNIMSVLRYNSMFALVALGMSFVIMTGGIDLSVGATAALASVVSAGLSDIGLGAGLAAGIGAGLAIGLINGLAITRFRLPAFVTTLATMLAARGLALLISGNQSVSVSWETSFTDLGGGDFLDFPIPAWIAIVAFIAGSVLLNFTGFGRTVLAIGGNEEAARLMGLPVARVKTLVYVLTGGLAGLAGVILAAQFGAGQPTEGQGWELFAIAAVVVGGTLLTGGMGSVGFTLAGTLLLGLIFNILNFENGRGDFTLSAYWQSVIRGAFLLIVVLLQNRLARRPT
ncbi:MAG TPA: ABC transporter permease [Stellaceae bacterium]|nr:ABC transporter permease [Stellaceae bacterium]